MAIKEECPKGLALRGFRRLQDHAGYLEHHAEEHSRIDASLEAYLKWLPFGYKFDPNDSELVSYLKSIIDNQPLPPNPIVKARLYDSSPMILAEEFKLLGKTLYFFTPINKKYPNGKVVDRSALNGYWKSTGLEVPVISSENVMVGYKRSLVYFEGDRPGTKTNWIMHEYKVADPPQRTKKGPNDMRLDDFVLCKFYLRTTKSVSERPNDIGENNSPVDLMPVQPDGVVENGRQILNFERQFRRSTKNIMLNTPKRQKNGSKNAKFDDSTILSQSLQQNTNTNLNACVTEEVENIDDWLDAALSSYSQYGLCNTWEPNDGHQV